MNNRNIKKLNLVFIFVLAISSISFAGTSTTTKKEITNADQIKIEKKMYTEDEALLVKRVYNKTIICTVIVNAQTMVHCFSDGSQKSVKLKEEKTSEK
jgi:hypothetical protein